VGVNKEKKRKEQSKRQKENDKREVIEERLLAKGLRERERERDHKIKKL